MSSEYLDWLNDLKDSPVGSEDHNHWLCVMFPWLIISDEIGYKNTKLSFIPMEWQKAFGDQMCLDINMVLEDIENEDYFFFVQDIKEKFGALRFYYTTHNVSKETCDKIDKIIEMYSERAKNISIVTL